MTVGGVVVGRHPQRDPPRRRARPLGRELGDRRVPGHRCRLPGLLGWLRGFGQLAGSGWRAPAPTAPGWPGIYARPGSTVVEVDRPDRRPAGRGASPTRSTPTPPRRAALAGAHRRCPRPRDGIVEAIRTLRVARRGAVKARTASDQPAQGAAGHRPGELREPLRGLRDRELIAAAPRLRPPAPVPPTPAAAVRLALRRLARRYQFLSTEIADLDEPARTLVTAAAPGLLTRLGVGAEVAGQLLVTAGDNPDRLRSEAAFAHLCGVAPIPASSGKTRRHRLNRGGDRAANNALYTVVLARLRLDPRTRAYVARRTAEGLSKREIIRCLQRYVARELYHAPGRTPRVLVVLAHHRDGAGGSTLKRRKARAAGLTQPLPSMTINARRGQPPRNP